eukprot:TRINITY_DN13857_c0_g1_i1.p1 TRINITY_DN13857_c0_g1~~TRINITY_DN13857_c0_g1_i1.p1  ORF type:complete len:423 (+),score=70.87 TRINITY_DN13857_c0_g1_i1:33-1301(+)
MGYLRPDGRTAMARGLAVFLSMLAPACAQTCSDEGTLACSLNGRCVDGVCECEPAWTGQRCEVLVRLPAYPEGGYQSPHDPGARANVSSWGGSVIRDENGTYHMYAAEMDGRCGIEWWEPNSQVVHAVSDSPEGPYRKVGVVAPSFAHEPTAMRAPTGEWVVLMTMRHPSGWGPVDCDTPSPPPPPPPPVPPPCGKPPARHTYMTWSNSPDGPWSEPVLVLKANTSVWGNCSVLIDTNLAGVILPNGSVVGIWRKCSNLKGVHQCEADCCTFPHLLTASNWRDPATYFPHQEPMFDALQPYGAEDPFVWRDAQGRFHAILHDEQGPTRSNARGRHAYSLDGATWYYGTTDAYDGKSALSHPIDAGNTSELIFVRRERPHMIIGGDGRPTHLINGVQEMGSPTNCSKYAQCDRSYTFIQPLRH